MEQSRQQFPAVTAELMKRTRRQGEFDRGVTVAVDFTKSPVKWHGDVERDADGNITEGWILDYKGGDLYYQIATIQIVGEDLPIIPDFVPVKRGRSRADIGDELLETAKVMVNVREIQADREFDVTGVRRVIQDHGCIYRTAGKVTGLRGTCTKLRNMGALGHVIEEGGLDGVITQKTVFVPAISSDVFEAETQEADLDDEADAADEESSEFHQELLGEFGDAFDVDEDESHRMFEDVLDTVREDEESRPESQIYGSDADVDAYAIFKTNDPSVSIDGCESALDTLHMAARAARPYRFRWAIEEGNKKLKQFMARTKSDDERLRFFNYAFRAVLYNTWRLVDLLVQLSLELEDDHEPHVTADEFLACAEEHFDLDTPPPAPVAGTV